VVSFWLMTTYLIISTGNSAAEVDALVRGSASELDRLQIESGKWLISSPFITSKEVADKLGPTEAVTYILCPIRGYFGRARNDIWEWLAAKSKS